MAEQVRVHVWERAHERLFACVTIDWGDLPKSEQSSAATADSESRARAAHNGDHDDADADNGTGHILYTLCAGKLGASHRMRILHEYDSAFKENVVGQPACLAATQNTNKTSENGTMIVHICPIDVQPARVASLCFACGSLVLRCVSW